MTKIKYIVVLVIISLLLVSCKLAPSQDLEEDYTKNGVWYEIFVRSFADGDGDGIGDFIGLTEKLDYLNDGNPETDSDLGINGIWLMPINPSPSYHGYDVTDYYDINAQYGGLEAFEIFLEEAHKRGIKVIMDLVVNHSSSQHPWFKEAESNPDSPYRQYYHWITDETEGYNLELSVWGNKVWNKVDGDYYYALFWDQMPDLNFENPAVREDIKKIAQFWLGKGVDGFRIDAAMHIYGPRESPEGTNQLQENLDWWQEFDTACLEINPDCYLVGEVWTNLNERAKYAQSFDSTFNFDVAGAGILGMVQNEYETRNNGFIKALEDTYRVLAEEDATFIDAPFLTNHDQKRAMEYFEKNDVNSMKLAFNILMTIPGNPFIYYGEEIGMLGNKPPDENVREPFIWGENDDVQTSWLAVAGDEEASGTDVNLTGEAEPGTIEQLSNPALDNITPAHDELAPTLGEDEIVIYYYRPDGDYSSWGFWIWAFPGGDGALNWDTGIMTNNLDEVSGVGYKKFTRSDTTLVDAEGSGVIPRMDSGWTKDGELDREIDTINYSEFVIISGDTRTYIYGQPYGEDPQIEAAFATDTDKIRVRTNAKLGLDLSASGNDFVVQNESGTVTVPVTDVVNFAYQDDRTKNYTNYMLVTLGTELPTDEVFYISRTGFEGERAIIIQSAMVQELFPDSLLNHYKKMIRVRQENEPLLSGTFTGVETTSAKVVAFIRETEGEKSIVIHNLSKEPIEFSMAELPVQVETLVYSSNIMDFKGEPAIQIPAQTTLIFK